MIVDNEDPGHVKFLTSSSDRARAPFLRGTGISMRMEAPAEA
jgi:hypothetical protein